MAETKVYIVLHDAWIAGTFLEEGDEVSLTGEEAKYPLITGVVALEKPKPKTAAKSTAKSADRKED